MLIIQTKKIIICTKDIKDSFNILLQKAFLWELEPQLDIKKIRNNYDKNYLKNSFLMSKFHNAYVKKNLFQNIWTKWNPPEK